MPEGTVFYFIAIVLYLLQVLYNILSALFLGAEAFSNPYAPSSGGTVTMDSMEDDG